MKVLRARIYDKFQQEAQAEYDETRKSAVGTGDRSERIRTYNFPQNRVTDHRIGLTIQKLDQILDGKLDEFIEALLVEEQTKKLEQIGGRSEEHTSELQSRGQLVCRLVLDKNNDVLL